MSLDGATIASEGHVHEGFTLKKLIENVRQIRLVIIPAQAKLLRRLRRIPGVLHRERFAAVTAAAVAAATCGGGVAISRALQFNDVQTLCYDPLQTDAVYISFEYSINCLRHEFLSQIDTLRTCQKKTTVTYLDETDRDEK